MSWLIAALLFVTGNFLLYTLALRHVPAFSRERIIFLYQVLSFVAFPVGLLFFGPPVLDRWPALAAAVSLHAIYSLSFLELWSLSEGSYSIRMLDRVSRLGVLPESADTSDLERIGASKKANRLGSLLALGLIRREGVGYAATGRGRMAALPLRTLVWLVNIRDRIG